MINLSEAQFSHPEFVVSERDEYFRIELGGEIASLVNNHRYHGYDICLRMGETRSDHEFLQITFINEDKNLSYLFEFFRDYRGAFVRRTSLDVAEALGADLQTSS